MKFDHKTNKPSVAMAIEGQNWTLPARTFGYSLTVNFNGSLSVGLMVTRSVVVLGSP